MTFNSYEYLIFYPLVTLLYFLLPKRFKMPLLLVASYFFYAYSEPLLLSLIVVTTAVSFFCSKKIEKTENEKSRKLWLAITLVTCLGILFFFKYFDFMSDSVFGLLKLFGGHPDKVTLNLLLPVGISFYTFQTLSYVIDVYRGDIKTEDNFFYYALFVSFFPQLVAGPIERPENLLPQLKEEHKFQANDATAGLCRILLGFFKKIVVADGISVYVNAVYNGVSQNEISKSSFAIIIATMLFAVQIYCDFSGYTDIAIGSARIMGIRLMKNFDYPYSASSVKEFWDRWHISLSSWLKDYLYRPLCGDKKGARRLFAIFIVFLASGFWHGAAWTFVLWGVLHGVYRILGQITWKSRETFFEKHGISPDNKILTAVRRVNTYLLVCFAWIFFRANSVADAFTLVGNLFRGFDTSVFDALSGLVSTVNQNLALDTASSLTVPVALATTVLSLVLLFILDRMITYEGEDGSSFLLKDGAYIFFTLVILIAWGLLLSRNMSSTFIYFQF